MKPEPDRMLQILSQTLMTELVPRVDVDYAQRSGVLVAMLLQSAAEQWDRGAQWRVEENRALRAIFRDAATCVTDVALRGRLLAAAEEEDASLRLSAIGSANDALRALLIELHAHVETLDGEQARRIEVAIWEELVRSTERRKLSMSPF